MFAVSAIMFIGVIVFVWTFVRAVFYAPEAEIAPPDGVASTAVQNTASSSYSFGVSNPSVTQAEKPNRLIIQSLGINANVQETGITRNGNMGIPTNFTDVAWYKYGPAPGQPGSAVLDGHVDNGLSLPGVFKRLDAIKTGDDIYVRDNSGLEKHFVVSDVQYFDYMQVPSETIFAKSGDPKLVLITCTGNWVKGARTYDKRLVVTAKLS